MPRPLVANTGLQQGHGSITVKQENRDNGKPANHGGGDILLGYCRLVVAAPAATTRRRTSLDIAKYDYYYDYL